MKKSLVLDDLVRELVEAERLDRQITARITVAKKELAELTPNEESPYDEDLMWRIEVATTVAEKAGTAVTIRAEDMRKLLDYLAFVVAKANEGSED